MDPCKLQRQLDLQRCEAADIRPYNRLGEILTAVRVDRLELHQIIRRLCEEEQIPAAGDNDLHL